MINLEVCIQSDTPINVSQAVTAAYRAGATRVELCSAMELHGLTPSAASIRAAREAFQERPGLLVMIRPRAGDFVYTPAELDEMQQQIRLAGQAGVDGVVLGALREDQRLDVTACRALLQTARAYGLTTTFHRAFDATPQPLETLALLIDLGVQRVLTSGLPWGHPGTALEGVNQLRQTIHQAGDRIEIVIGGGIKPATVGQLLKQLPLNVGVVSVHAYSGAQEQGQTTVDAIKRLLDEIVQIR